jgi:hypothetical protein
MNVRPELKEAVLQKAVRQKRKAESRSTRENKCEKQENSASGNMVSRPLETSEQTTVSNTVVVSECALLPGQGTPLSD